MKKEGEVVFQVLEKKFPCSLWRTMLEQISTLQLMEDPMWEQVDVA